ncbi:MAG: winged helix-turn-helix transcriptional regulator [Chloroflexi bacterium]|nr:winged helix-turn-helix transcriptional regulator [Chloroflexota bacterium]
MVEILRNKNLATKFQILVEIASRGPNIQQRDVAKKLGVTPQAVSDYIKQLSKEGLLTADGRSKYAVTNGGVNWIIKTLRELRSYNAFIEKAVTNISTSAAIAESNLTKGQPVGLIMKDGLLFATEKVGDGARGLASAAAKAGEDVGISNIEGIVKLATGKVTILKVPSIQRGGSSVADFKNLRKEIADRKLVGAIGIEAIVALRQTTTGFVYAYGATEAAIEAAQSGLAPLVACVDDMVSPLLARLQEQNINYDIIDLTKRDRSKSI